MIENSLSLSLSRLGSDDAALKQQNTQAKPPMSCARAMSKAKLFRRWREHDDPVPTLWYGIAFVEYYRADVLCFF